ncbi:hypothetical protein QR680_004043 [Steinernema hermaphroditum]|uniref:Uncharacterized protein n=1 Tax=Steinernema hermaphroditum TaxID=289476 RepID=A0AA39LTC4_9BILA|nr:hypothetical protein QR680_004043 [Steinernema hermaphroditum]
MGKAQLLKVVDTVNLVNQTFEVRVDRTPDAHYNYNHLCVNCKCHGCTSAAVAVILPVGSLDALRKCGARRWEVSADEVARKTIFFSFQWYTRVFLAMEHVETLSVERAECATFDFATFRPAYLSKIVIQSSQLPAGTVFSDWLKAILRTDTLKHLEITGSHCRDGTIDIEDTIYDAIVSNRSLTFATLHRNSFMNFDEKFFKRIVQIWKDSEMGFGRSLVFPVTRAQRQKNFFADEIIHHKSGRSIAEWRKGTYLMRFIHYE